MKSARIHVDRTESHLPTASLVLLSLLALLLSSAGCGPATETECRTSNDCLSAQFCRLSRCVYIVSEESDQSESSGNDVGHTPDTDPTDLPADPSPGSSDTGTTTDADLPGSPDLPHPCPEARRPEAGLLLINELLPNVPTGPEGDANADGSRSAHDDEFVEIVNISPHTLDLEGVGVANDTSIRFTFPPHCLAAGHGAVIFAASTSGAPPPAGEGFDTWLADSRFQLANDGGRVALYRADGQLIDEALYTNAPPRSLNRSPELSSGSFAHHTTLSEDRLFSPGTCADGRPLTSGCAAPNDLPDGENNEGDESSSDPSPPDDAQPAPDASNPDASEPG
ncbi:lamin tail domain-containing protein [Bradymonadaceae bacterium TMQ3]|uniref:Lamin tail domain-containing protein n=1 Tax=Lujinxingia sediminis TaxID=2480984 RepID=A0ABY0CX83_9DELT|nr:lamin tail domain-containing protein [Lujinxingia sediminis]RDV39657.1 lamin tail domain-containing protein [Bradymonadaceae bacterium TMQ3]RVU48298.1 lamin tail domain-containing protein [Lujinxingia sediminis]TXC77598.1 lamin tail domain-containing protein [Bradymonadales bacterium TMQ1]